MFWRPDWLVSAVRLTAATGGELPIIRFDPGRWPGTTLGPLPAPNGWHLVCRVDGVTHRLWWPEHELPAIGTPLGFACDLDPYTAERTAAVLSFWRAISGAGHSRGPLRLPTKPPAPRILRRIAILRALDGRLAGASYRTIADVLLGAAALTPAAWKTGSRRGRAIRLVAAGRRLMDGGYRDLLKPPRRRRAQAPYQLG